MMLFPVNVAAVAAIGVSPAHIGWAILAVVVVFLLAAGYCKAPPDKAYIISGLRKRVLIGRAGFRIPFFERLDRVTLELIQVDVKTKQKVPNKDFINVNVDAVVNIKISKDPEKLALAATHFLNASPGYINEKATEVLEGNMREIVGEMTTKEMVLNRKQFAESVQKNASPDLEKMGLEIVSFNVQNFTDDDHAIENLGIDNIATISKDAAIARANAEAQVEQAKAMAAKEANDARVAAQTEIAIRNNELDIKKADLKKQADIQLAIAEAAKGIQAEEQRKILEETTGDASIIALEKQAELQQREVTITEKKLDAEIRKKAEAEKFAAQQQADARLYSIQKNAEAELAERTRKAEAVQVEAEREADATKAAAEAALFQQTRDAEAKLVQQTKEAEAIKAIAEANKVKGENEAYVIKAKGDAEAEAIRAKALAEAEGLEKKAEAMAKYGEAAKMDLQLQVAKEFVKVLPGIASGIAEAYAKVGNITIYGDQSGKIASEVIDHTTQLFDGLSKSLGFDVKAAIGGALAAKLISSDKPASPGA
jgi:flotillin